jgi:hypothetical protein
MVKQREYNVEKKSLRVIVAIWLGVLTTIISSCATSQANLVKKGILTIEQRSEGKVQIAWSDAYEKAGNLLISGVLLRHDHVGLPIKAHVEATIVSPDDQILDTASSKAVYVPKLITGRGQSLEHFSICFSRVPPPGSTVRLVCHSDPAT